MAYEVMILCHLHMPLYFLGTFTEYPLLSSAIPSRPPPHGTRTCQVGFLQGICTPVRGRTEGAWPACHHRLHTTVGQPRIGA